MMVRFWCIGLLVIAAALSQLSGYYVRQEAAELRALVRQVNKDSARLDYLRTAEMFARRHRQVEAWAGRFEAFGPPAVNQLRPSLRAALAPAPLPRPVRHAPEGQDDTDMIATLISTSELAL